MTTRATPLGVLIIGRKRPGFDQQWNEIIRRRALAALLAMGYEPVGANAPVIDDATIIAAIDIIRARGCRALVVLQPSLGHGQLAMAVLQRWDGPIVLWATPERIDVEKVSSCSLVAQHLWAATLRQANHPFELVYGDPDDAALRSSLGQAVSVVQAVQTLRHAKVGLIGSAAPGFLAMRADLFALRRQLGVQLHDLSLPMFIDRVRAVDDAVVRDDLARVRALGLPMRGVAADDLAVQSRFYLGLLDLMREESLDALAVQEWPEMPNVLDQWPYLAMSRLMGEGHVLAMEGDVDAAVAVLAGKVLGTGPAFITDWLEHDDETIHFWHPGICPPNLIDSPSLGRHFNIDKPMVVDGPLRADQPVTIARLWRCDDRYMATAFQGRTVPPRRKLSGNQALVRADGGGVREWFDTLCHAGMPHHPILFQGDCRDAFRRLARMLRIDWVAKDGAR
jgi:L-fucose isomerase-like protein